jgi:hypothetical protein
MANPNIVNVSTIYGNTGVLAVNTSYANVVSNPASSNAIYKVNSLNLTNACTATLYVTVQLNQAGTNTNLIANVSIPTSAAVSILGKDTQIYLLENNSLQVNASSASYISAICSWEQIS